MSITMTYSYLDQSDACYRWQYSDDREVSTLYIHMWRVPTPIPMNIDVTINFSGEFQREFEIEKDIFIKNPKLLINPIIKTVYWSCDHGRTIRYEANNKQKDPPFPTIYIPKFVFEGKSSEREVQIVVDWR